jgi:hypothetical protein
MAWLGSLRACAIVGSWSSSELGHAPLDAAQPRARPDRPVYDFILVGIGTARRLARYVGRHEQVCDR